ncbi:MAG: hypothetical protein KAU62_09425 [Candidatus Heimdallarchaeota archaeon]|nr:hypothetical protein [Candidatus Heimdallarchaeota archaeon]MCG3256292.1 hypothetical protein [Candidatus Heimdallarchaeota archaeon]MCK4611360.1 hypothetical protein [Candidatus Heimdallarchaeota archaeon]
MSWIRSIFSKGKKKSADEYPILFNGLYRFNHSNIITDKDLNGCEISDTLFIEGDIKESPIGLVFGENYGLNILKSMKKRFNGQLPSSLVITTPSGDSDIYSKLPSIELPSLSEEEMTFFQGKKWYTANEERINSYVDKLISNKSLVFLFPENNAFVLALFEEIALYILSSNKQPVMFVHLPVAKKNIIKEFSIMTFIYGLLRKSQKNHLPYVLVDEEKLIKNNQNKDSEEILATFVQREANLITDFIIGLQQPSEFYQVDQSNFLRIFKDARGICRLISFDVYDNNPELSQLLAKIDEGDSFSLKTRATRGFFLIQPGPIGLTTASYRRIRERFSNSDVIFSFLQKRENGAILRGILTYNILPREVLKRLENLGKLLISLYDELGDRIMFEDSTFLGAVFDASKWAISLPVVEKLK